MDRSSYTPCVFRQKNFSDRNGFTRQATAHGMCLLLSIVSHSPPNIGVDSFSLLRKKSGTDQLEDGL